MGHYDECREGYCGVCGQTRGNCQHTKDEKVQPIEEDICFYCSDEYHQKITSFRIIYNTSKGTATQHIPTNYCPVCGRKL
jgi:hypothetical protein